jgi:hypothetical protein
MTARNTKRKIEQHDREKVVYLRAGINKSRYKT